MNSQVEGSPYVLFVDDEEMTRKTFERIASQEFPVLLAGNVAEAKDVLQRQGDQIGVLLTDQRMPGGLGVELLEYARDEHPTIVRMLTTAYSELEDAIAAVNRGEIIRYIEKPWSNIDALLIDLRVAMRFHLLESSNQELMSEKMSAKARGARIERIQVLAALAAARSDSRTALSALEALLRKLSELRNPLTSAEDISVSEMYSGPEDEANQAIAFAKRISIDLSEGKTGDLESMTGVAIKGDSSTDQISGAFGEFAGELILRGISVMGSADPSATEVSIALSEKGTELKFSRSNGCRNSFSRWVNLGSDHDSTEAMADLLRLYLLVYEAGADIDIDFNEEKALSQILISLSSQGEGTITKAQESDWLEDIFILFS